MQFAGTQWSSALDIVGTAGRMAWSYRLRRRCRRHLRKFGLEPLRLRIVFSRSSPFPYQMRLAREGEGYLIDLRGPDPELIAFASRNRLECYIYWLSRCPAEIRSIGVDLSDGDNAAEGPFCASSDDPEKILLPDPYFFMRKGFADMRAIADADTRDWAERSGTIRWRGTTTGTGRIALTAHARTDPTVLPRLRMLMLLRDVPGTDALFAAVGEAAWMEGPLRHFGYFGERIAEGDWINDKYALDIDGFSNTWSNLLARMHLGCCVLKVASQQGYRQWYYDRLEPWTHYVPVRSDMSDLAERIAWVRGNQAQARAIASAGQAFARSMTMESETRFAVDAIVAAHRAGRAG